MNIFTIDTVLDKTYISFLYGKKALYKTILSDEVNYHSAYLIKNLDEILKSFGASLGDFEYLGINIGTGSFTGIRAGLAVAKIITERLNIKAVPFKTQGILSKAYACKNIMTDAKRGSVFYSNDGENIELIPLERAQEIIDGGDKIIVDNSLLKKFERENLISYEKEGIDLAKFELEIVKSKIEKGDIVDSTQLKPLYIQTPPIFS